MARILKLILTSEMFDIGGYHPELDCNSEIFLGVVSQTIFDMMGWKTKRQGTIIEGKGPVFMTRKEMIQVARNEDGLIRSTLLKTLLKAESTRRMIEMLDDAN